MRAALHISTVVRAGHKIEVTAPELREGEAVEVFLITPAASEPGNGNGHSMRRFFDAAGKDLIDSDAIESLRRASRI